MMFPIVLLIILMVSNVKAETFLKPTHRYAHCQPTIDLQQDQYLIGYGSLMNEASKKRTDPTAGPSLPVKVKGLQRSWVARAPKNKRTFLAVLEAPEAEMNGVLFKLPEASAVYKYDAREGVYCRKLVSAEDINIQTDASVPQGQIWVYYKQPKDALLADAQHPILQTYIDTFVSGCLELETKYRLAGFTSHCIASTTHWSPHVLNNRSDEDQAVIPSKYQQWLDALKLNKLEFDKF